MHFPEEEFDKAIKNVYKHFPNFDLQEETLTNTRLLRCVTAQCRAYYNTLLAQYHLHETLYYALILLYHCEEGHLQPSDLSRILDLTRTNSTRLSDEMVENGWVHREPSKVDRRVVLLSLTEKGNQLVEEIMPKLANVRRELWKDFSDEEIQQMQRMLRKLNQRTKLLLQAHS